MSAQKQTVAVRLDLPLEHHQRLRHLAISERRPAAELLVDAVTLLLRYHGEGEGIPIPPGPSVAALAGKEVAL